MLTIGMALCVSAAAAMPPRVSLNAIDLGASVRQKSAQSFKVPEEWIAAGEATVTDDLIASVYKEIEPVTFTAPLEKSASTEGLYRLVNPYKNWSPGIEGFSYDDSRDYYMILHAENSDGVWIEDFSTGWSEDGEDGGEITVSSYTELYLSEYEYDLVYSELPDLFGKIKDDKASFPVTFLNFTEEAPVFVVGVGDTSAGYYAANTSGAFTITLPGQWEAWGKGQYTDDMLASVYGIDVATKDVAVERHKVKEGVYRVVNPYEPWTEAAAEAGLVYDGAPHYMVVHCEHAPYVWIEDFETGFSIDGDKVVFASDASYFTAKYGFEDTLDETPDIYGRLEGGVITYAYEYDDAGEAYPCLYLEVGENAATSFANKSGKFRLKLPAEGENTGDPDWTVVGEGTYTDDLMTALVSGSECQTYKVTIEKSVSEDGKYRLVNPYAGWAIPAGSGAVYDSAKDYYMVFHIAADPADSSKQYVMIDDFNTGVSMPDYEVWVTSEAVSMAGMLGVEDTYAYYPELFGEYKEGVVTYAATWSESGTDYPTLMIMQGEDSWDTVDANTSGRFRIVFPGASSVVDAGIVSDENADAEYYDMNGMRVENPVRGIYIMKQGDRVSKVVRR